MKSKLAKLALTGIIGGSITLGLSGCTEKPKETTDASDNNGAMVSATEKYKEIHSCSGLNVCKGLGGCKVSAEKLIILAENVGMAAGDAGEAHSCKGLNECKGLGGCHVDATILATLKSKMKK